MNEHHHQFRSDRPHRHIYEPLPTPYPAVLWPAWWMERLPKLTQSISRLALVLLARANSQHKVDIVDRYRLCEIEEGGIVALDLMDITRLKKSSVSNALTQMIEWGWISRGRYPRARGTGTTGGFMSNLMRPVKWAQAPK